MQFCEEIERKTMKPNAFVILKQKWQYFQLIAWYITVQIPLE